ncbi:MAG: hypothetical protein ACXVRS_02255 [Gaiellaceae bacterium]
MSGMTPDDPGCAGQTCRINDVGSGSILLAVLVLSTRLVSTNILLVIRREVWKFAPAATCRSLFVAMLALR